MKYTIILIGLIVSIIAIIYARYRLHHSEEIIVEGYLIYKVIDLGQGDFIRTGFEEYANHYRIPLQTEEGQQYFYVKKEEKENCWLDSTEMLKQGKSKLVQVKTKKLLFGGFTPAHIISIKTSDKKAIFRKS